MRDALQKHVAAGAVSGKAVADEAHRLDVKDKATLLLVGALFTPDRLVEEVGRQRDVLVRFTRNNPKVGHSAPTHSPHPLQAQRYLLGGFEQLIAAHRATLLARTPLLLKTLYDADVLDEATLLAWADKPTKKFVAKEDNKAIIAAAAPLLKWLREAEEETSDEDDEVEFADQAAKPAAKPAVKPATNGAKKEEESEEEEEEEGALNIDDI